MRSARAIAEGYLVTHQLDSAQTMMDTVFSIQKLIHNNYEIESLYRVRAEIQSAQGDYRSALSSFEQAKRLNAHKENLLFVGRANKGIADAYWGLGRVDSAIAFYKEALLTPDTASQVMIHAQLSKIYQQLGQDKRALFHERQSHALNEAVYTIEKNKELAQLLIKKEADDRIREAENQQRIVRLRSLIGFILLGFALVVSLFWTIKNRQQKEIAEARIQLKAQALAQARASLADSEKQLNFKDTLIKELQLKLVENQTPLIETNTQVETNPSSLRQIKILTTEDWMGFRHLFDKQFPHFTTHLKEKYAQLTPAEVRLCMLIKAGFDSSEVAYMVGISLESVYKTRYRVRHKIEFGR